MTAVFASNPTVTDRLGAVKEKTLYILGSPISRGLNEAHQLFLYFHSIVNSLRSNSIGTPLNYFPFLENKHHNFFHRRQS